MSEKPAPSEYLVLSRGQWDADKSAEDIQQAIDAFYLWHDRMVREGKMRAGQRLAHGGLLRWLPHGRPDEELTPPRDLFGGS